jgi:hypothetical protein
MASKLYTKECSVTINGVEHKVTIICDYSKLTSEQILDWAATKWIISIQDRMRLEKLALPDLIADRDDNMFRVHIEEIKAMGTRSPADLSDKIASVKATALEMGIELTDEQALAIYKKSIEKKAKTSTE